MGRPLAIPRILTISWWWLLWISIFESVAWSVLFPHHQEWVNSIVIWMLVQAIWLKRAEPESKAIYWYAAADLLNLGLAVAQRRIVLTHWTAGLISLATLIVATYGIFQFKWEMERHFNETDPVALKLSGWMTFFFSYLYFQYHFQQIHNLKHQQELSLTPAPSEA